MIKKILRAIVVRLLEFEAKLVLRRYKPRIIGVIGNTGKTSTKEAIYTVLNQSLNVRRSEKSFNSEIGVPLSIIGRPNAWGRPTSWIRNFGAGLALALFRHDYPDWLVLEIGVDRPGDMKRLSRWLKLEVIVITSLPEVPVHLEFFHSAEALIQEKLVLLNSLKKGGLLVLNGDDERIRQAEAEFTNRFRAEAIRVVSYGFRDKNDFQLHSERLHYEGDRPVGLTCKVDHAGHSLPLRLPGLTGRHQLYAVVAGLAVGVALDLNFVEIAQAVTSYLPPPGRLCLIDGVKGSTILDDTYNSSPLAVTEALKTLKSIETKGRRIAVLGDMMELGEKTIEAHEEIGRQVVGLVDILMTVGIRAEFIYKKALEQGFNKDNSYHFTEAREAGEALEQLIGAGDIILVKGSQSLRLERVVEEIMAHPESKADLLVRQEEEWQER